ncbi:MAG: hypothetical protein ACTSRI_07600 [Promethearchaeota archaeon]
MINEEFKNNWLKIIDYNSKVELYAEPKFLEKIIRIPLTPIKVKAHVLYHIFETLYPKYINDNQNILDVIISDNGKNFLGDLYLYKTKKAGIHGNFQTISNNVINNQEINLEDIDGLFTTLQLKIVEKTDTRISMIRIFKKKAIDLINKHCINIETIPNYEFLQSTTNLVQELCTQELIYIYPEPNIYKFLKNNIRIINPINLTNIFGFINEILPEFNISIIINSEKQILIIKLQKVIIDAFKSNFIIKLLTPEELEIEIENLQTKELVNLIREKLKTKNSFYINQNHIISLSSDLFDIEIPPKQEIIRLLFQKILYGYRSFENAWYLAPQPIIYNTLLRFMIRLLGFNINLKKISHWTIPSLIFNSIDSSLGINSKVLIIITDVKKSIKSDLIKEDILKIAFNNALLIEIENRNLKKLTPISKNDIISDNRVNSLDIIRNNISIKFGFISVVIIIDKFLLYNVLNVFIFKISKLALFSKLKVLKMFKNRLYFNMYPELLPFKMITNRGIFSLLKMLLPVIIDKHEF